MKNLKHDSLLAYDNLDKLFVNGIEEKDIKKSLKFLTEHSNEIKAYAISHINDMCKLYVVTS